MSLRYTSNWNQVQASVCGSSTDQGCLCRHTWNLTDPAFHLISAATHKANFTHKSEFCAVRPLPDFQKCRGYKKKKGNTERNGLSTFPPVSMTGSSNKMWLALLSTVLKNLPLLFLLLFFYFVSKTHHFPMSYSEIDAKAIYRQIRIFKFDANILLRLNNILCWKVNNKL